MRRAHRQHDGCRVWIVAGWLAHPYYANHIGLLAPPFLPASYRMRGSLGTQKFAGAHFQTASWLYSLSCSKTKGYNGAFSFALGAERGRRALKQLSLSLLLQRRGRPSRTAATGGRLRGASREPGLETSRHTRSCEVATLVCSPAARAEFAATATANADRARSVVERHLDDLSANLGAWSTG